MLVKKIGTYLAQVTSIGVEEKDNGTAQAIVQFDCESLMLADGATEDVTGQMITGYFNLVTKAGKLNEINIRSLKESIGWDGTSFSSLQDGDFNGVVVQIVVDEETYNDKTSMRIKYLNPKDYTGGAGAKKADATVLKSLDAKFGSMLRATAASMPAGTAAKKATGNSTGTASKASPPLGKDMAWKALTKKVDAHNAENPDDVYSDADRKEVFQKIAAEFAKPKKASEMTPEQWANFTHEIDTNFSPAARDLIPF